MMLQMKTKEDKLCQPQIPGYSYKKNFYAKDPHEAKYQFLINKKKSTGLKYFNDSKAFIKYSNNMGNNNSQMIFTKILI